LSLSFCWLATMAPKGWLNEIYATIDVNAILQTFPKNKINTSKCFACQSRSLADFYVRRSLRRKLTKTHKPIEE
jgi:hypothetical protein